MKQFIVFLALTFIFAFVILQWTSNETSHLKRNTLFNIVEAHAQDARKDGYFTTDNINAMKTEITDQLYISESEIRVTVTDTPKYRTETFNSNELITYKVEVPIKNIIAMSQFFGISDDDNKYWFPVEGKVTSERLVDR